MAAALVHEGAEHFCNSSDIAPNRLKTMTARRRGKHGRAGDMPQL